MVRGGDVVKGESPEKAGSFSTLTIFELKAA